MTGDPVIRDAVTGDAGAIMGLIAEGFDGYRAWAPDGWQPPAGDDPTRVATLAAGPAEGERSWVAEAPFSGLAGVARLSRTSRTIAEIGDDGVILRELFVARRFWGTGVGPALLRRAVDASRGAAFATIWLATPAGAARARAFYARHGFTESEQRFDEALGLDLVVLARSLRVGRPGVPGSLPARGAGGRVTGRQR